MKIEISPEDQAKRIKHWLEMLAIWPADSPEGINRDQTWKAKLESELDQIERAASVSQVNCLAYLAGARNHLRKITP